MFGFSRGAFTARSIAGLIAGVGLLTKAGLPCLAEVFKDFENRENPNYRPANPDSPFPNKPSSSNPRYEEEIEKRGLSRLDIPIKVVGVWDTVGECSSENSLPIPYCDLSGETSFGTKSLILLTKCILQPENFASKKSC